ncbi:MAG TPA: hypothetical protein VGK82_18605 [Pyrinomonadaceae bacterium]
MKRFLSTTAFVVVLAVLFLLGTNESLTAETNTITSTNQPIAVLGVNVNRAVALTNWLDAIEVQIENTSQKTIKYLLLHVEVTGANGQTMKVPVTFGQPANANAGDAKVLQPGAKISLNAAKSVCDRLRAQIANDHVLPPKQFPTSINVVIFGDKTAWKGGQLHYQDPADPLRWIAASELTRTETPGIQFAKTNYRATSNTQTCYRTTGFNLQFCCDSNFVANEHFSPDPNGHTQPVEAQACCGDGDCCTYTDIGSCP